MTTEWKKQYQKEWREKNRERINQRRIERMREKALAEISAVNVVADGVEIITKDGKKYRV